MNAADRRRLTPLIAVVAVVLAALLIALWAGLGSGASWHDAAAAPKLPRVESTTPPPQVAPLPQYSAVWEHPLFSPTRTPEPAGRDTGSSGNLQLTGVIMLPGLEMAILHDKDTGKDYRVIAGQPSRGGPVLVELHPRSAVVESGGERLQLHLVPGPSPGQSSAPEGAGSPGGYGQSEESAEDGASAMVTRQGARDGARQATGAGPASAEARARALKARIEARRRRAKQDGGG